MMKARAQREGAPVPRAVRGTTKRPSVQKSAYIADAWAALPELEVDARQMHRKRITAYEGGTSSAPSTEPASAGSGSSWS